MPELSVSDLINLVSISLTIAGILVGFFGNILIHKWPNKLLWKFKPHSKITICLATSDVKDTGFYQRPMTGLGQVQALAKIIPSLQDAYGPNKAPVVRMSTDTHAELMIGDLVLLGGVKNNDKTELLLSKLSSVTDFKYAEDYASVTCDGETYSSELLRGKVTKDFGFIISTVNPLSAGNKRVVLLAGLHTAGVNAAASYFVKEMKSWQHVFRKNFLAIVEVSVVENQSVSPKLICIKKI